MLMWSAANPNANAINPMKDTYRPYLVADALAWNVTFAFAKKLNVTAHRNAMTFDADWPKPKAAMAQKIPQWIPVFNTPMLAYFKNFMTFPLSVLGQKTHDHSVINSVLKSKQVSH